MAQNMAIDAKGRPLPYSSDEVKAIVDRMIQDGDIAAVLVRGASGDLGFHVFGDPSTEILEALEQTVAAYRTVLKGQ